jgi:hypothetical protein
MSFNWKSSLLIISAKDHYRLTIGKILWLDPSESFGVGGAVCVQI